MKNIFFKNEQSFFGKIEKFSWSLWEVPFVRFLVAGGLNTALGVSFTYLMRYLFDAVWLIDPKSTLFGFELDWPSTLNYALLFPVAYTTQALLAFRTRWTVPRMFIYPISTIPNYLLNQIFIFIFEGWLMVSPTWSYFLATILPIPIMYVIIKFLVVKSPTSLV